MLRFNEPTWDYQPTPLPVFFLLKQKRKERIKQEETYKIKTRALNMIVQRPNSLYTVQNSILQVLHKPFSNLSQQMMTCISTINSVITVGVKILLEILICLNQCF